MRINYFRSSANISANCFQSAHFNQLCGAQCLLALGTFRAWEIERKIFKKENAFSSFCIDRIY